MADAIIASVEESGIYQIRNTINGKIYIGSAKSFKVRWGKHLSDLRRDNHHSAYLQRSWNAHGADAFAFEIIELCSVPELIGREQSWLDQSNPDYNVSPTAANCTGVKHSDATKLKHTLAMTGRKFPEAAAKRTGQKRTPEQRARFSAAQRLAYDSLSEDQKRARAERTAKANRDRLAGRKQSPEHIAARSAGMIGRVVSEETRAKLSAAHKGKKLSAEHKQNLKDAWRGRSISETTLIALRASAKKRIGVKRSAEAIAAVKAGHAKRTQQEKELTAHKMSEIMRGKKLSAESIAKRDATRRANGGYKISDETRKKLAESMTGRTKSEATRTKLSASKKGKTRHIIDGAIRYL